MPRLVRTLTPEEEAEADLSQALFYQRMKERAFLCYLLARPSEMERFMGNVAMNEFFVEGRNCCIFECMEQVYLKHGTIDPREYRRLVQTDFAPQLGVPKIAFGAIASGGPRTHMDVLVKLASILQQV